MPLGASQVHKICLRAELFPQVLFAGTWLHALEHQSFNREYCVRTRRVIVHRRRRDHPGLRAERQELPHVVDLFAWHLVNSRNVHAKRGVVYEFQLALGVDLSVQQVVQLFVVDLDVRSRNAQFLQGVIYQPFFLGEQLLHEPRNDPWGGVRTEDREALAAASLPVGEEAAVVTVQSASKDSSAEVLNDFLLRHVILRAGIVGPVGIIEREDSGRR
mmetsp:Transcript_26178/g.73224  ORF Transcript_26178/g.73224 Transcript_26178/m.73224 type:complete len:216 (-) Transcript_26178:185-832(-)